MASSTASISGLVSGLDTASIISQLMQLEAAPQTALKTRLTSQQSTLKVLQSVNSSASSLATKASALAQASAWVPAKASSNVSSVTATATSSAAVGTYAVTVLNSATAHRLNFTQTAATTDVVTGASHHISLTTHDGTTHDLDTGDGSLSGIAAAINGAGLGVRAALVDLGNGQSRLRVESSTTGAASDFTLTAADGSALLGGATVTAGSDAAITFEGDTITSSTNQFAGVIPGTTLTVGSSTPAGTAVQVVVSSDSSSASSALSGLIDSVNSIVSTISAQSAWNSTSKTTGPLGGDVATAALKQKLAASVFPPDGSSLAGIGVQIDRYGAVTFDATKFQTALASDPEGTLAKLTGGSDGGFVGRIVLATQEASNSSTGTITQAVTGQNTVISRTQSSIDAWDLRLELRQTSLQTKYTALETALSSMKNQQSWLTAQLNSLSSSSSSSSSS